MKDEVVIVIIIIIIIHVTLSYYQSYINQTPFIVAVN